MAIFTSYVSLPEGLFASCLGHGTPIQQNPSRMAAIFEDTTAHGMAGAIPRHILGV